MLLMQDSKGRRYILVHVEKCMLLVPHVKISMCGSDMLVWVVLQSNYSEVEVGPGMRSST